jgi:methylenetetrahydrofolate dehydrogenase (NADP+)/methenyltetrahydrofolate cyclohydrolase
MPARILDGKSLAEKIEAEVVSDVEQWVSDGNARPTLHVLLASGDYASSVYVKRKQIACKRVGIDFGLDVMTGDRLMERIKVWLELKGRQEAFMEYSFSFLFPQVVIDWRSSTVFLRIRMLTFFIHEMWAYSFKDAPYLEPCTPQGVRELLVQNQIALPGKKVVVINRSDVVGKALHSMLIQDHDLANATVTLCHDNTPPEMLKSICLEADIVVVAVGIPKFLTEDMVTEKSVVIDVGINRMPDAVICGDVDFDPVARKVQAVSKVPGGIGPLTIACLLRNTVKAAKWQLLQRA